MKNIIVSKFTQHDVTAMDGFITGIETTIEGKTGHLTAEERVRYGSVNEQNKLVINKSRDYRQNQPALSSPTVDWTEFESDYQARHWTENWINRLEAIVHSLKSTKIMHDYDNFQDALKDYGYSQFQEGAGEDGYSAKVEDLSQFFAKSGKNKLPDEAETDPKDEPKP